MGTVFPDGASVLAGARVCVNRGHVSQYRWAFGIEDVLDTIVQRGPVVLGVNWYESMYNPGRNGLVEMNGQCVGGHCILATGYIPNSEDHPMAQVGNWTRSQDVVELTNSWGRAWGVNGKGYIRVSDLDLLLKQQGEACIATDVLPKVKRPWYQRMIEWL